MPPALMDDDSLLAFRYRMKLRAKAQGLLGEWEWSLLESYGKLMAGPYSGLYVSALSGEEQLEIAERLVAGERLHIHLMHRHRSGHHEISSLRWDGARLVMVFEDGDRFA